MRCSLCEGSEAQVRKTISRKERMRERRRGRRVGKGHTKVEDARESSGQMAVRKNVMERGNKQEKGGTVR